MMNDFKCPKGLTNKDAICTKCEEAKPTKSEGTTCGGKTRIRGFWLNFPDGHRSELIPAERDILDRKYEKLTKGKTCIEWDKKHIMNACGCGGTISCICGYENSFCSPDLVNKICPFCGREYEIVYSGMYTEMAWSLEKLRIYND